MRSLLQDATAIADRSATADVLPSNQLNPEKVHKVEPVDESLLPRKFQYAVAFKRIRAESRTHKETIRNQTLDKNITVSEASLLCLE